MKTTLFELKLQNGKVMNIYDRRTEDEMNECLENSKKIQIGDNTYLVKKIISVTAKNWFEVTCTNDEVFTIHCTKTIDELLNEKENQKSVKIGFITFETSYIKEIKSINK